MPPDPHSEARRVSPTIVSNRGKLCRLPSIRLCPRGPGEVWMRCDAHGNALQPAARAPMAPWQTKRHRLRQDDVTLSIGRKVHTPWSRVVSHRPQMVAACGSRNQTVDYP